MRLFSRLADRHGTEHVAVNTRLCVSCGECVEACPGRVLKVINILGHSHVHVVRRKDCLGCLKCVRACPQGAIRACNPAMSGPEGASRRARPEGQRGI